MTSEKDDRLRQLFVSNLSPLTTASQIIDYFSQFDRILCTAHTKSATSCLITFESIQTVNNLMSLKQRSYRHILHGQKVTIRRFRQRTSTTDRSAACDSNSLRLKNMPHIFVNIDKLRRYFSQFSELDSGHLCNIECNPMAYHAIFSDFDIVDKLLLLAPHYIDGNLISIERGKNLSPVLPPRPLMPTISSSTISVSTEMVCLGKHSEAMLALKKKHTQELESQINQLRQNHQKELLMKQEEYEKKLGSLESTIEELKKKNDELQANIDVQSKDSTELDFMRTDRKRLVNDKEQLRRENEKLHQDLTSLDELRRESSRFQTQINTLLQENNDLIKSQLSSQTSLDRFDHFDSRLLRLEKEAFMIDEETVEGESDNSAFLTRSRKRKHR